MMNRKYLAVVSGSFILMIAFSLGTACLSFFIKPVTEDLGLERGAFTLYYSLMFLTGMLLSPFWGRIISRFGVRKVVIAGSFTCSLAFFLYSYASSLPAFYAVAILLGIFFQASTVLSASISINLWFNQKRGQMLGIVMSASGLGAAIFSFILPRFISTWGWRPAYMLLAICWLVLTLPSGLLLIKNRPEDYGMNAYGYIPAAGSANGAFEHADGINMKDAMKNPRFYLLMGSLFLVSVVISSLQHMPSHFAGVGLSEIQLGSLMSIFSVGVIISKISIGTLSDHIGLKKSLFLLSICGFLSYIILNLTGNYFILIAAMILFATFNPAISVLPPLLTLKIYGKADYAAIWSVLGMAGAFGQVSGAPAWGLVYDLFGSYLPGFMTIPFMILISCLLAVYCLQRRSAA